MPDRLPAAALLLTLLAVSPSASEAQIYTRTGRNGVIEATNVPDEPGYRLTYPGKGTLIHSRAFRAFAYRGEYDSHIQDASSLHGVSPDLVRAVIQVESEFDRYAVSSKGAQGLMQLMPFTARRFGVTNAFDPRQNIFGGTQYLRLLLDMFGGDVSLALAGYNAGENAVTRYRGIPPYRETQGYVAKIQSLLGGGGIGSVAVARASTSSGMVSFAPSRPLAPPAPPPARPSKLVPARPRVYYKWHDQRGQLHVADGPPAEGVAYSMIRALD